MEALEIITPKNPTLRRKAAEVEKIDKETQDLIDRMIYTMREANGVGLAAPQIDKSMRLAVIETPPEIDEDGEEIPETRELYVIINPEIVWQSRKQVTGIEGCLSIPGYLGEVDRSVGIRVKALDRFGRPQDLKLKGWPARVFQHEIDHLDGVLYTDKLTDPDHYWTEEEYEELMAEEAEEETAPAES